MNASRILTRAARHLGAAALSAAMLAGCADAGHPRGMFSGYVMAKTEAEVTEKIGKPDSVDASDPNQLKWVYKRKTFDPDNMNKPDDQTILTFKRDAKGQLKVAELDYL